MRLQLFTLICIISSASLCANNKMLKPLNKLLQHFDQLDRNQDGNLSQEELQILQKKMAQNKNFSLEKLINHLDKNSDKGISKMELQTVLNSNGNLSTKVSSEPSSNIEASPYESKSFLNLSYGEHERNVMDVWLAKSDQSSPMVIYIHGGGFKGGDKKKGLRYRDSFLKEGISFAAINYRFLPQTRNGVFDCFNDSKRALQFISSKAQEWNLDRSKFALCGGSAGAGTCLWLAYKDDMADPNNSDPILKESTRVAAVAALNTQCSYDFTKWTAMFELEPQKGNEAELEFFYGLKPGELKTEKGQRHIQDADLVNHISKDDPPLYANNKTRGGKVDINDKGHVQHHPLHVKALKDKAQEVGLRHQCHAHAIGINDNPEDDTFHGFLIRELKK
ncbi:probable lipase/esterase [Lentisphaera araneosa HTCC2155]|uniref:Probable lipase/esterase n=1 Tax=Lentisphaera araneosa HTCC2155 TaxID=313628 RepID=A6DRY2_9BACT|nr:EF-hand domain-containing protein [Lentisphaera araneosa]EDM25557.1 probable lipase/esterase [Lentisphaera araneosa HTCC2155]